MYLSHLSTPRLLDAIKSRLDDYRADEALTHDQWRRVTSPRRMLRAINEADIQLCGDLKVEKQIIIYLPEETSTLHMSASSYDVGEHANAIQELIEKEPDGKHYLFFNENYYQHIGTLRSQYIVGYKDYPVGSASPAVRYGVVPFTTFQKSQAGRAYCDDRFGMMPTAHVDHGRGVIQLSRTQEAGTFLTFKAHILPEKVDFNEVENTEESVSDAYTAVTPTYAERALVLTSLVELLPETNPVYNIIQRNQFEAFKQARLRVPTDNSVKKVESWL